MFSFLFKLLTMVLYLKYTNVNETKKYYLADVEDLDSPARLLLEKLHFEADKKRKFSAAIPSKKSVEKKSSYRIFRIPLTFSLFI